MKSVVDNLLKLSDREILPEIKDMLKQFDHKPTPMQVFNALEKCKAEGLASDFVVATLQLLFEMSCDAYSVDPYKFINKHSKK